MPLGNRRTKNICFNSPEPFSLTFTACLLSPTWLLRKSHTQFGNWKENHLFYRHKLPAVVTLRCTMEGVNLQSRPREKLALDCWLRMGHFPEDKQFLSFNKKPKWMVMLSRRNDCTIECITQKVLKWQGRNEVLCHRDREREEVWFVPLEHPFHDDFGQRALEVEPAECDLLVI